MSASPQATATDRTSKPAQGRPPALIHTRAPEGCVSETTSTVATAAGPVTIRVRRFNVFHHVGGRGTVLAPRVEVAVKTPRSATEGRGFVVVDPHFLDEWTTPADDLRVHVVLGAQLEEVAESRASERRAEDRAPRRARLFKSPGAALHAALGAAGIGDHYRFASRVLGRRVASLGALSADDVARVRASLALASDLPSGEVLS